MARQELIPARHLHPSRMGPPCLLWGLVALVLAPSRVVRCSSYDNLLRELGLPGHLALRPFSLSMAWLASYSLFGIPRPERGTMMVFYRTCNARLIVDHWLPLLFTVPPNCTPNELIAALETRWPDLRETEWQAHYIPWPTSRGSANGNLMCFIVVCAGNGPHSFDRPQGLLCLASSGFELAVGITTSRMINILSLREFLTCWFPWGFPMLGWSASLNGRPLELELKAVDHGFLVQLTLDYPGPLQGLPLPSRDRPLTTPHFCGDHALPDHMCLSVFIPECEQLQSAAFYLTGPLRGWSNWAMQELCSLPQLQHSQFQIWMVDESFDLSLPVAVRHGSAMVVHPLVRGHPAGCPVLVKAVCPQGYFCGALLFNGTVSAATLLLSVIEVAPSCVGARNARIYHNNRPLDWDPVEVHPGDFFAIYSW